MMPKTHGETTAGNAEKGSDLPKILIYAKFPVLRIDNTFK